MANVIYQHGGIKITVEKAEGERQIETAILYQDQDLERGIATLREDAPTTAEELLTTSEARLAQVVFILQAMTESAVSNALYMALEQEDMSALHGLEAAMADLKAQMDAAQEAGTLDTVKVVY